MTIYERLFPDLSGFLPRINRSREYHLYDGSGGRYLDMYLAGGTALLGHRPEGISLSVKNAVARGLWAGYPSPWSGRLVKELNTLLPDFSDVLIFPGITDAELWLKKMFHGRDILDPAVHTLKPGFPALWRPFCPGELKDVPAVMAILPFPGTFLPGIICCRPDAVSAESIERCPGGMISPVLLAGMVRAAALLRGGMTEAAGNSEKVKHGPKKRKGGEIHPLKRRFEPAGWERRGPYLKYTGPVESYREYFDAALKEHILLPPTPFIPAIIPGLYSSGEIAPLSRIFNA